MDMRWCASSAPPCTVPLALSVGHRRARTKVRILKCVHGQSCYAPLVRKEPIILLSSSLTLVARCVQFSLV